MTKDEALKLALEALELAHPRFGIATDKHKQTIAAVKEALAQPERKFDPNDSFARDAAAADRVREFMRNH